MLWGAVNKPVEGAMFVQFEIMVLMLRDRPGFAPEEMRARHTVLD